MASVHAPTLLYPNGGESLATPTITVRWENPSILSDNAHATSLELFYTDDFRPQSEPNWIAISSVPSTATEFVWRVGRNVATDRARVSIRTRTSQGARSIYSISASDFSINRSVVTVPRIINPVSKGRYDSTIQIVVASDRLPDRSYYQFYYSSVSANIPMTSIGQRVLARDIPLAWVTVELPAADDYQFYAAVIGPDGITSDIVSVGNISIAHEGFFIIDTLPPKASIRIEGDSLYTKERDISVSVYSYDEATGVQSMQLKDGGTPQKPKLNTGHVLAGDDGVKQIQALIQDFGANRNNDGSPVTPVLVNAAPIVGENIVDHYVSTFSGVVYVHFVTSGDANGLYEFTITNEKTGFPRRITTISETPTAVAAYNGEEYISVFGDDGFGSLWKFLSTGWSVVKSFGEGVQITDLEAFNGHLYIGTNTGHVWRYDGSEMVDISEGSAAIATDGDLGESHWGRPAVKKLKGEGSKLFVLYENSQTIGILIGDYLLYR